MNETPIHDRPSSTPDRDAVRSKPAGASRWLWLAPALLLAFGATIFGMVLAGGLDLTVPTLGATRDDSPAGERVAAHAQTSIASFADLAEAVLPAVVSIRSTVIESVDPDAPQDMRDLFEFFQQRQPRGNEPRERRQDGGGSGFVISPDGWIVTNYHVIDGATRVTVVNSEGEEFDAEVRGQDAATDIALLKIEAEDLTFLELGDSDALRVGDWVMAIGNPYQLASSVTVGVVSAKGRSGTGLVDRSFEDFIQTDAAINRGNSGGPLVNTAGQVIGIATAMNFGAENIGFAVPVRILEDVLPDLKSEGRVTRGYLGVNIRELERNEFEAFGLESASGALVLQVVDGTPAAKAGLQAGDVILRVDRVEVVDTEDLIQYVSSKRPGTRVELELLRNGKRIEQDVLLEERDALTADAPDEPVDETSSLEWLGMQYQGLDRATRSQFGIPSSADGVLVVDLQPSSPLYDEGIRPGALISEVNGRAVDSVEAFEEIVGDVESGGYLRFFYQYYTRQGAVSNFAILRKP